MKKEYLESYIEQGLKTFACNLDKTPATTAGFYAGTCNPDALNIQFHNPEKMLIGLPTGNLNGLVVIDVDVNKDGDTRTVDELIEALREYGPVPTDTYQVQTPSGGRHLFYKVPFTKLSSKRRFFDDTLPIDVRANGGYVCTVDGDNGYIVYDDVDGLDIQKIRDRCLDLPDWMNGHKKQKEKKETETLAQENLPPEEIKEIRSALAAIPSDDRDLWVKMGMALKSTGSPSAFNLWHEWSQKSDKYNPKDIEGRWKGFKPHEDVTLASVFYEAKKYGWITTYEKTSNTDLSSLNIISRKTVSDKKPFPEELLRPDGLVGELIDYINAKSIKPQPILALGAALAAIGALQGRKIQTNRKVRTNIYCLGVGASGCGKESARSVIKEVFYHAGCGHLASVETLASDAAIITALKKPGHESQIFLIDEIGRFIKTTNSAAKNPHLYNINTTLLTLYSSSHQMFHGKNYADAEKQAKIDNPNLCLYGTTVPEVLYEGLPLESLTNGFLSRMLIFESESPNPYANKRIDLTQKPPKDLIDKLKHLFRKKINIFPTGNVDQINVNPQIVPLNENALDLIDDFETYITDMRTALMKENRVHEIHNRTAQMAEQIALIVAGGIDIDDPVITEKEMLYGIQLAKYLADNTLYIAENFVADNDYQHALKKIFNIIRDNGKTSVSLLTSKTTHLQQYLRKDIINTLKESDLIAEISEGEGKKKKTFYVALQQ